MAQRNKGPTKKKVKIINASNTRANFHIIAPINTNRWQISYEKPEGGVVPGKHVEITVNFIAPKSDDLVTDNIFQVNYTLWMQEIIIKI